jgi:hypothetical protein
MQLVTGPVRVDPESRKTPVEGEPPQNPRTKPSRPAKDSQWPNSQRQRKVSRLPISSFPATSSAPGVSTRRCSAERRCLKASFRSWHWPIGWVTISTGGGPTPDKPDVTLVPPSDTRHASSFLNIRVSDIHAVYEQWRSRGAEFLTPPTDRGVEIRCYMRDPDGHLIEVGQLVGPPAA